MSEAISALLGAIIGGSFSLLGTWLTLRGSTDYFDKMAIPHFKKLLKENPDSVSELMKFGKEIGLDEKETKQLIFIAKAEINRSMHCSDQSAKLGASSPEA